MFLFLGFLLVYALLSFGAVLPASGKGLLLVWFLGSALVLIVGIFKRQRLRFLEVTLFAGAGLSLLLLGGRGGFFILATLWAWTATKNNPGGIPRFFRFLLVVGCIEAA